jgi:hypothetical protein
MAVLTPSSVYETLKQVFPAKNDDYPCDYREELEELIMFGITTDDELRDLLQRRAKEIMEIDRSPMNQSEIQMHSADGNEKFVADRIRAGYWFAFPALLRIALELEFGQAYVEFSRKRDGTL